MAASSDWLYGSARHSFLYMPKLNRDPSAMVRVQPKICDLWDHLLSKHAECTFGRKVHFSKSFKCITEELSSLVSKGYLVFYVACVEHFFHIIVEHLQFSCHSTAAPGNPGVGSQLKFTQRQECYSCYLDATMCMTNGE